MRGEEDGSSFGESGERKEVVRWEREETERAEMRTEKESLLILFSFHKEE